MPRSIGAGTPAWQPVEGASMRDWNALADEDFRREMRSFFATHYPPEHRHPAQRYRWSQVKDWYQTLYRHEMIAPGWPEEHGGMGLSPAKLIIFIEEQERHGVARVPDLGLVMVGPMLIANGTRAQQEEFLPRILSGENIWCQGYSEPNAGSDLASLRTSAVRDGDDFVVNGHKIWTSFAQDATHMFLLARTDTNARKQDGISFLLADLKMPGFTIREIDTIAGHAEFCEVFLDNVRIPARNLVGEPNNGWHMAKSLLGFERLFLGGPKQCQLAMTRLDTIARDVGAFHDPVFVDRLTQLELDVADHAALYTRFAKRASRGEKLGPELSVLKIWAAETFVRITDLIVDLAGSAGAIAGPVRFGADSVEFLSLFYLARSVTIYGGSNEIQRNIVAKSTLNLPG
jgi:alkylation response protein AidB-like acyl-CoA dehydrogenase